ncbi:Transient receptor putative cation channel sub A member 1 [Dinochytrium kinnereticum]|nr:Transient receptor putative cation channel sub A member 1 [Dinochytrium kinnereticum]
MAFPNFKKIYQSFRTPEQEKQISNAAVFKIQITLRNPINCIQSSAIKHKQWASPLQIRPGAGFIERLRSQQEAPMTLRAEGPLKLLALAPLTIVLDISVKVALSYGHLRRASLILESKIGGVLTKYDSPGPSESPKEISACARLHGLSRKVNPDELGLSNAESPISTTSPIGDMIQEHNLIIQEVDLAGAPNVSTNSDGVDAAIDSEDDGIWPDPNNNPDHHFERRDSAQGEDHNMTCLHYFALTNRPPSDILAICADPVAKAKLNVNAKIRHLHLTALHFAAMNASVEVAKTLVGCGANLDSKDILGKTPLRLATTLRRVEIVQFLLERGARDLPDREGITALRQAIYRGDLEIVGVYLSIRPEGVNQILSHSPIEIGASDGKSREVDLLPLHVAASFGRIDMIRLLLRKGANINGCDANGRTPLMYAATKGKSDAICALIMQDGIEISSDAAAETALWKLDVDRADNQGWTALHYAAAATKGDVFRSVQALLENGAFPDPREYKYLLTPLHMASKSGSFDAASELLKYGADAAALTSDKRTSIHFAAYGGHAKCLSVLLKHDKSLVDGIGVSPGTSSQITPLHLAIRGSKKDAMEVVKILIEHGADVTAAIRLEVDKSKIAFFSLWNHVRTTFGRVFTINSGASANKSMFTFMLSPICFAIAAGHLDAADIMLQSGVIFHIPPSQYLLCVVVVSTWGRVDMVLRLTLKTSFGITLLGWGIASPFSASASK